MSSTTGSSVAAAAAHIKQQQQHAASSSTAGSKLAPLSTGAASAAATIHSAREHQRLTRNILERDERVLWSRDGGGSGYKSLSPFAVGADGSTVLRVQVAFTPGAEASYRSVVTATVNDNGYMQYFRAPGPGANPPVFEQELSGFAAADSGSTTNKLVLNADCETLFEAQVVFANAGSQDNDAGSSSGQGGDSDGSTPPPQGGFEDSTGSSDEGSGSSSTTDFIDEDGNGIPDNIFASSSGATETNSTGTNPDDNDGDGSLDGASAAATVAQPLALFLAAALSAATALLVQR